MKQIESKEDLQRKLKIDSLSRLNEEEVQRRFIKLATSQRISPELFKEVLSTVSKLTSAFVEVVRSMADVGLSLEATKQKRWDVLQTLAQSGSLSADQMMEAIKLIAEIDQKESIDWNRVFDKALDVLQVVATVALLAVVVALGGSISRRGK